MKKNSEALSDWNQIAAAKVDRRSFLSLGGAGIAAAAAATTEGIAVSDSLDAQVTADPRELSFPALRLHINGTNFDVKIDPRTTLLDCLRETLSLTGTKKGCDHGQCGACTVHVNGRRVNSCLTLALMHEGDQITTIEGVGQPGNFHPMQAAFIEHDAFQCGYCTSGQIMSAVALLKEPCGPKDADVKELMSGNICRCGAYPNILAAVQAVRKQSRA